MRSELLDGGRSQRIYEDLLDERLAESISRSGGFGIGTVLYERIIQSQAVAAETVVDPQNNNDGEM